MKSRRKFIQNLAAFGAALGFPVSSMGENNSKQKMIHQVFFWLHPGQDVKAFISEASKLKNCRSVGKFYIGTPASTEARDVVDHSYQVACTFFFDSLEDQDIYQKDPIHLKFIEKNSNKWTKVKVYDFVI